MSFISYAQNFEDVMLWRALKNVQSGFYVDVGACWPVLDSVTAAFYERGWRGVNIEPNAALAQQLRDNRPNDVTLQLAVGDRNGVIGINFLENSGLSTADDEIAAQHKAIGWQSQKEEVGVTTLAAIWLEHVPAAQDVHFLKVDVEGFEEQVLRSNDWTRNRPWIVVVEAMLPLRQEKSHEVWEPILLGADYRFAYADGLNRFYVAAEHASALLPAFEFPPNFFDAFVMRRQVAAEAEARLAQSRASTAEARAAVAEAKAEEALRALEATRSSSSWRLTAPLRWIASRGRRRQ